MQNIRCQDLLNWCLENRIQIIENMGQQGCCEAVMNNTSTINPRQMHFLDIQDDPEEAQEAHPAHLTTRTAYSKRLGDSEEGQFIDSPPQLLHDVAQRLASLQSIEMECYRRLKNERGISETGVYFRFSRTGVVYEGQWLNSKPHGYGKNLYRNGGYYEGTFYNGLPHGYGRFINPNGDYYQGSIKFGRGNGQGYYYAGDVVFHGEFKDNNLHGEGEQRGADYYFKGSYEYGSKAKGTLKYGACIYEGGFQEDQFEGKGVLTTGDGRYVGEFYHGNQHGYGQFVWNNGSKYRGNYVRGMREGDGEFFNAENNTIVRGLWRKGKPEGDGEYVQPRGCVNKVVWSEGHISALK